MLEKILEEIEGALKKMYLEVANNYDISDLHYDGDKVACVASRCRKVAIQLIKEIFQKHMNDLSVKEYISRQEAINVVMQGYRYESDRMTALQELPIFYMNDGKDTNVPTNDGWILTEERLPEDGESVLCTNGEYVYLVEYDADLDAGFGDTDEIIAWQPLPEPYRPEKGE